MANYVVPPGGIEWAEQQSVSATVTGPDQWTAPIAVNAHEFASISVRGEFDATVVCQRLLDGIDWATVPNEDNTFGWTANTEQTYECDEGCWLRLGVAPGDYVSGTIYVRIGKG